MITIQELKYGFLSIATVNWKIRKLALDYKLSLTDPDWISAMSL